MSAHNYGLVSHLSLEKLIPSETQTGDTKGFKRCLAKMKKLTVDEFCRTDVCCFLFLQVKMEDKTACKLKALVTFKIRGSLKQIALSDPMNGYQKMFIYLFE